MKDPTDLLGREFLKKAGVWSVAMASLPALGRALPLPRGLGDSNSDSDNFAVPKTIFDAGTRQAKSLNSFKPIPSWGAFQAVIADMFSSAATLAEVAMIWLRLICGRGPLYWSTRRLRD